MWDIMIEPDGCPIAYQLCRCESPDIVGDVVRTLCRAKGTCPIIIKRVREASSPAGDDANPWPEEVT